MHNPNQESAISGPINLLKRYNFESNGQPYETVLNSWLERFPLSWVNLALIESLHQGRYKVVSVEQILTLWQRRGKPSYHFNHDFERLVSNNLPQTFKKKRSTSKPFKKVPSRRDNLWQLRSGPSSQPLESSSQSFEVESSTPPNPVRQPPTAITSPPPDFSLPSPAESLLAQIVPEPASIAKTDTSSDGEAKTDTSSDGEIEEPFSQTTVDHRIQSSTLTDSSEIIHSNAVTESEADFVESEKQEDSPSGSVPFSSSTVESLKPIHQFVPQSTPSLFYSKLTAMAQAND